MFPHLQTDRCLLQEIKAEDQAFIFEGLSHPKIIPFYGVSYHSFEATTVQMNWYRQIVKDGTGTWWKIIDKKSGERVGAVGFNYYNALHSKCEIGYWLLPQFWGKGIIAEVLKTVIAYLQNEKKVHRIEASVDEGNERSRTLIEKAGFIKEGKLRDYERKNGEYISLYLYSLLSTDKLWNQYLTA